MKIIHGNLITLAINGEFDVIIHGCNCFCKMGKGIALSVRTYFPEAYEADKRTGSGDKDKLGSYSEATFKCKGDFELTVINAYTQYRYGSGHDLDLKALEKVLFSLRDRFNASKLRIGIPQIGCGYAGGNWDKVLPLIEKYFGDDSGCDVTVVIFSDYKGIEK